MTTTLREMVVEYIANHTNDPELQYSIITKVQDEFPTFLDRNPATTVKNWTNILARNGIWGDSESCLAIARIFERDIQILSENRLSLEVLMRIYRTVIIPAVLFGLKYTITK